MKIFDKVLSLRVTDDIPNLVGVHHSAFVRGRAIHDNFMMVQGMAKKLHSLKHLVVMIKLHIFKAFDSVQWPFTLEVPQALGFGRRWIAWIAGLFSTTSTRILFYGVPGAPIRNKKGFRQADPLSPMMFILMMEPLHGLFALADSQGLLSPLSGSPNQRVLIFADDVMLFLQPEAQDLHICNAILGSFAGASGLQVNRAKTCAMPIRCSEEQVDQISELLGRAMWAFPCCYLGLLLSLRKLCTAQLDDLVVQVARKLPSWRGHRCPGAVGWCW